MIVIHDATLCARTKVLVLALVQSTPDRTRTCDLRIRNPLLYPAELRELKCADLRVGRGFSRLRILRQALEDIIRGLAVVLFGQVGEWLLRRLSRWGDCLAPLRFFLPAIVSSWTDS